MAVRGRRQAAEATHGRTAGARNKNQRRRCSVTRRRVAQQAVRQPANQTINPTNDLYEISIVRLSVSFSWIV
jgi:hypothetical protein